MKTPESLPREKKLPRALVGLALGLVPALAAATPAEPSWRQYPPLPDPSGFASPFAGVAGGDLVVAGGANFPGKQMWEGGAKVWHDRVFVLKAGTGSWELAGRLPMPLAYGVSVSTEAGILCAGGSDAAKHHAGVFLLQWREGRLSYQTLPALPLPIALGAGARVGEIVYLAGGLESPASKEPLGVFLAFDLRKPEAGWQQLPSWPGPGRFQAVAAAGADAFYLCSGLHYEAAGTSEPKLVYLRDAYRYSEKTGWEKLPDLPYPAVAAANPAPVIAEEILLVGGVDGSGIGKRPQDFYPAPRRIQVYSIRDNVWTERGLAPVGRVCVSTAFWDGRWIFPSGERSPGVRSPEVWAIEPPGSAIP